MFFVCHELFLLYVMEELLVCTLCALCVTLFVLMVFKLCAQALCSGALCLVQLRVLLLFVRSYLSVCIYRPARRVNRRAVRVRVSRSSHVCDCAVYVGDCISVSVKEGLLTN